MTGLRPITRLSLFSLPTAVVLIAVIWFGSTRFPVYATQQRQRIHQCALTVTTALDQDLTRADFIWQHKVGVIAGGVNPADFPADLSYRKWAEGRDNDEKDGGWGYRRFGDRIVAWVRRGDRLHCAFLPETEPDFATELVMFGALILAVLLVMTGLGARYLYRLGRERDDFMNATAHDLTTPLVGMRFALAGKPEAMAPLVERMLRIVTNLRDFMRLGGRRPPPAVQPFDFLAAWREAYGLFAEDYRQYLNADLPITAPARVTALGDETLAVQILWNLLGNDLKYAAPYGAVRAKIEIRDGKVVLELADEGQGMTAYQRRHAFDRYYRAKTVRESGKGGFGIGLCNAREFARAMGGEVSVRPNVPRGCIFTLTLPVGA